MHRILGAAVIATAALAASTLAPSGSSAAASTTPQTIVALGDSYAAGPFIPVQYQPFGCLKSTMNYAHQLATALGATLTDATCSGASTHHMWDPHGVSPDEELAEYMGVGAGGNPPQLDSLRADTDLVTLQIGGNDIGFGSIATDCGQDAIGGSACRDRYQRPDGSDELQDRIAATGPKIRAVLEAIHERSPDARILVLGYPGIFHIGDTASCPAMGVGEEDAQYLRNVEESLDAMIAGEADRADATYGDAAEYVDIYAPSAGFTACDTPILRWTEPIVPVNAAAPVHPNLTGMTAIAGILEQRVTS
jgi:lysophospholipase L1-like esterase